MKAAITNFQRQVLELVKQNPDHTGKELQALATFKGSVESTMSLLWRMGMVERDNSRPAKYVRSTRMLPLDELRPTGAPTGFKRGQKPVVPVADMGDLVRAQNIAAAQNAAYKLHTPPMGKLVVKYEIVLPSGKEFVLTREEAQDLLEVLRATFGA